MANIWARKVYDSVDGWIPDQAKFGAAFEAMGAPPGMMMFSDRRARISKPVVFVCATRSVIDMLGGFQQVADADVPTRGTAVSGLVHRGGDMDERFGEGWADMRRPGR
jgi:hypothetical protein